MHEAVCPIPGSCGSGRPKMPGTPVSMNPFGIAALSIGARGFEMSITYSTPTPSLGSFETSRMSPPRSTSSFSKCGSGSAPTGTGSSGFVTS